LQIVAEVDFLTMKCILVFF